MLAKRVHVTFLTTLTAQSSPHDKSDVSCSQTASAGDLSWWRHMNVTASQFTGNLECLYNRLFRHMVKKYQSSTLLAFGRDNPPMTGELRSQRTNTMERVSRSWHCRVIDVFCARHPIMCLGKWWETFGMFKPSILQEVHLQDNIRMNCGSVVAVSHVNGTEYRLKNM